MDILLLFTGFIFAVFVALLYEYKIRQMQKESRNKVHFYVEMSGRDKELKLYIQTIHGYKLMIAGQSEFKWFGLNPQDFDFIEEYKPVEVFLNIKN